MLLLLAAVWLLVVPARALAADGCATSPLPGCGSCACQACVCLADPYCCTGKWDALCVTRCQAECGGCGPAPTCGDGTCAAGETCKVCAADCGECPVPCGAITPVGCCVGTMLLSCLNGALEFGNCAETDQPACGWLADEQRYGCGGQGGDPAGQWPAECPSGPDEDVVEDTFLPEVCLGVGYAGCCKDGTVVWCDPFGLHDLPCAGNPPPFDQCGWNLAAGYYDCGGAGADPSGESSAVCPDFPTDIQAEVPDTPECKVGTLVSIGCKDVSFEGCCTSAGALLFCEQGKYLCELDCTDLLPPANTCGWVAAGWYDCGGQGTDPSGDHPMECPGVEPPPDVPDVVEVSIPDQSCEGVPEGGCCDGSVLHWCESGLERTFDCASLAPDPIFGAFVFCGANPVSGATDCIKKADPSPPSCEGGTAEPADGPDAADAAGEGLSAEMIETAEAAGIPDASEIGDAKPDLGSGDSPPFIVGDAQILGPEPQPASSAGCGCRVHPRGHFPAGAVFLLVLILAALRRVRPVRPIRTV